MNPPRTEDRVGRFYCPRMVIDHLDDADGVVLDDNLDIGNPADAP